MWDRMKKQFFLAVKSKTVWSAVALFLVGGLGALDSFLPAGYKPAVETVLAVLVVAFKLKPSQDYK